MCVSLVLDNHGTLPERHQVRTVLWRISVQERVPLGADLRWNYKLVSVYDPRNKSGQIDCGKNAERYISAILWRRLPSDSANTQWKFAVA